MDHDSECWMTKVDQSVFSREITTMKKGTDSRRG